MGAYLSDLLARLTADSAGKSSEESISWKAHREAEKLTDPTIADEVMTSVAHERDNHRRSAMYFIVGKIGLNTGSQRCLQFLISRLGNESNKYVLATILDAIAQLPMTQGIDLSKIYELLSDERWLVRHSAIQALRGATDLKAEEHLLRLLERTTDPHDQIYCHATLNQIGTRRALPLLERALSSRKRDVKMSAEMAIKAIVGRSPDAV